ncbi:MAG: FUN14 domain-containing protein [Candidatus Riflebacteria bacterium]|jgi:uncharacterized membrane protein (Fun14 family)|nr:FUN14 domain-containing protein [Candidatus Riflebacteria bacterium]
MSPLFNQRLRLSLLILTGVLLFPELLEAQAQASATAMPAGEALPSAIPADIKFMLATLGGGGIAGWAVGYTLKKFAKLLALVVGVAFISLQVLAFNSFITIDWERIKSAVPGETIEKSASGVMSVITYNLPFAGSFLVGFWLGFRKG